MEYVSGGSLKSLMEKYNNLFEVANADHFHPFPEAASINYGAQIVNGLSFLVSFIECFLQDSYQTTGYRHKSQLIHRDIKPSNILVTENGIIKIADLGCVVQEMNSNDMMNLKNKRVGTIRYMAPEVLKQFDYSYPVDIYSFGCTLLEIMTGKPPFANETIAKFTCQLINEKRTPEIPSQILSPEAYEVLVACTKFDPSDRPDCANLMNSRLFATYFEEKKLKKKNPSTRSYSHMPGAVAQRHDIADLMRLKSAPNDATEERKESIDSPSKEKEYVSQDYLDFDRVQRSHEIKTNLASILMENSQTLVQESFEKFKYKLPVYRVSSIKEDQLDYHLRCDFLKPDSFLTICPQKLSLVIQALVLMIKDDSSKESDAHKLCMRIIEDECSKSVLHEIEQCEFLF
ncbi:hypothetical protein Ciccas_005902 [Cichlidogyrus casuarinus]|uniref:Protein kinase domain-containing protein n=1 Tax=Cichlidogyrus casuarinus TaxID=1844966 RepID=A0ABD2Q8C2_9PLAT